ncbi:deoxyribose-phosphate aldolase [Sediminicola sp. YIK13]|uniref:deoxyribose-phosphate aldolase n=1 Tax=Sediminicola sp. YIK13 TaxID=1453352 RepID=UPI000720BBBB|nr:deoxyribose-phosphate aldolase [Sediminicola sp. YIK13]ALM06883.1 deoxyribose-phosphate aldolase [Sediminicola sp. YIK13]
MGLENYIDHTLLKPTATNLDIINLCAEAKEFHFFGVCVNGCHVPLVKKELQGSPISIVAVIGFPLGAMSTAAKICEAQDCISNGADEIDMVLNIGWLKSKKYELVLEEITEIKQAIGSALLKVIIETCYLTEEEKIKACELIIQGKADYVKTSTGFGTDGATYGDVALLKKKVGDRIKIKASGGIKNTEMALKYIDLGASKIGTSSGINITRSL